MTESNHKLYLGYHEQIKHISQLIREYNVYTNCGRQRICRRSAYVWMLHCPLFACRLLDYAEERIICIQERPMMINSVPQQTRSGARALTKERNHDRGDGSSSEYTERKGTTLTLSKYRRRMSQDSSDFVLPPLQMCRADSRNQKMFKDSESTSQNLDEARQSSSRS